MHVDLPLHREAPPHILRDVWQGAHLKERFVKGDLLIRKRLLYCYFCVKSGFSTLNAFWCKNANLFFAGGTRCIHSRFWIEIRKNGS